MLFESMRRFVCLHFEYCNLTYMCKQKLACAQPTATYKKTKSHFNTHATSR